MRLQVLTKHSLVSDQLAASVKTFVAENQTHSGGKSPAAPAQPSQTPSSKSTPKRCVDTGTIFWTQTVLLLLLHPLCSFFSTMFMFNNALSSML